MVSRKCRWESGPWSLGRKDPVDGASGVSRGMPVGSHFCEYNYAAIVAAVRIPPTFAENALFCFNTVYINGRRMRIRRQTSFVFQLIFVNRWLYPTKIVKHPLHTSKYKTTLAALENFVSNSILSSSGFEIFRTLNRCFLRHVSGQELIIEGVDDRWPVSMLKVCVDSSFSCNVRLVQVFLQHQIKIH